MSSLEEFQPRGLSYEVFYKLLTQSLAPFAKKHLSFFRGVNGEMLPIWRKLYKKIEGKKSKELTSSSSLVQNQFDHNFFLSEYFISSFLIFSASKSSSQRNDGEGLQLLYTLKLFSLVHNTFTSSFSDTFFKGGSLSCSSISPHSISTRLKLSYALKFFTKSLRDNWDSVLNHFARLNLLVKTSLADDSFFVFINHAILTTLATELPFFLVEKVRDIVLEILIPCLKLSNPSKFLKLIVPILPGLLMFKKSKSHHFFSMSLPFTNHLLWGQVNNHQDHGLSEIKSSNFICLSNFILNFASLNNFVYLNETLKEDYLLAFWNIQFFHVLVLHQIKVILLQEKVTEEFQLLANQYGIIVIHSIPPINLEVLSLKSSCIIHKDIDSVLDSFNSPSCTSPLTIGGNFDSVEVCEIYGEVVGYSLVGVKPTFFGSESVINDLYHNDQLDSYIITQILLSIPQFLCFTDNVLTEAKVLYLVKKCISLISFCYDFQSKNEFFFLPGGGCWEINLSKLLLTGQLSKKIRESSIQSINEYYPASLPYLDNWITWLSDTLLELPLILCKRFIYPQTLRSGGSLPGTEENLSTLSISSILFTWKNRFPNFGVICKLKNSSIEPYSFSCPIKEGIIIPLSLVESILFSSLDSVAFILKTDNISKS